MIFCQYLMKVGRKKEEDRKVLYKLLLTRAKKNTLQLSLKLQYNTEGNQLVHPYHHHKYIEKPKVIKDNVTKTDQMNSQKWPPLAANC